MSVYLGLGSNIGDRAKHLAFGRQRLEESGVKILGASVEEITKPYGKRDQPDFLNQVLEVDTDLDPHKLLQLCKAIEWEAGRSPGGERWGPRELDVDILIYHDQSLNEQHLTIPHPALPDREFLHRELAEIAPTMMADAVVLVRYDPEWPKIFEAEAERLRGALDGVLTSVDHVGSTAVPGLVAKAIIDIQASVDKMEPGDRFIKPLEDLGYAYVPDPRFPTYPFFRYPADGPRLFHLHVALAGSPEEKEHIAFRDRLRGDEGMASMYVELKRNLARKYFTDRVSYSNSKGEFIGAALTD